MTTVPRVLSMRSSSTGKMVPSGAVPAIMERIMGLGGKTKTDEKKTPVQERALVNHA
jgi:hypothetical protein